jgi:hypothetical protein
MVVGCHQQPTIVASFFDNGGCTLMATNPTRTDTRVCLVLVYLISGAIRGQTAVFLLRNGSTFLIKEQQ